MRFLFFFFLLEQIKRIELLAYVHHCLREREREFHKQKAKTQQQWKFEIKATAKLVRLKSFVHKIPLQIKCDDNASTWVSVPYLLTFATNVYCPRRNQRV